MQNGVDAFPVHGSEPGVALAKIGDLPVLLLCRHRNATRPKRISTLLQ
jgi:hypothetical protein